MKDIFAYERRRVCSRLILFDLFDKATLTRARLTEARIETVRVFDRNGNDPRRS